jgi:hypothetical protein
MTKNRVTHIQFSKLVLQFIADKEAITEKILSGELTHDHLAKEHGIARSTVSDLLTAAGIPTKPVPKNLPTATHKEIAVLTAITLAKFLRKMGEPSVELEELLHKGGL